ncbi:homocysteine S-methyltransferase [Microbacterium sp. 1P10UB]|uniref:homocysteine S-methyltransferase n=1 Tax=unclassified Microbacterium TaxID=2609290 RepID=UPI0039A064A2
MSVPSIVDLLGERPLVLDGGLGTLLEARGHDLSSSLWSARLLRDDPDEVRVAHAEFVTAGADVLITSSYQVGYDALAAEGLSAAEVDELLRASVRLAREAADDAGRDVLVAASIGPYGAVRADGSEYTGVYDVDAAALRLWHRRRLQVLADAGADLIAVETLPSLAEVEAVAAELAGTGAAAWISLSGASSGFTRATRIAALAAAAEVDEVVAVGVNCCPPGSVAEALADAPDGVALVAYPNSGEQWDAHARAWHGAGNISPHDASAWIEAGARLVGGCCRTTPADIAGLVAAIRR